MKQAGSSARERERERDQGVGSKESRGTRKESDGLAEPSLGHTKGRWEAVEVPGARRESWMGLNVGCGARRTQEGTLHGAWNVHDRAWHTHTHTHTATMEGDEMGERKDVGILLMGRVQMLASQL